MSSQNLSIDVHHVTRIEGHGNIEVSLKKERLKSVPGMWLRLSPLL